MKRGASPLSQAVTGGGLAAPFAPVLALSSLLTTPAACWKDSPPQRSPGLQTSADPYQKKSSKSAAEETMAQFSLPSHLRASVMGGFVGPQEPFPDNEESPIFIPGELLGLTCGKREVRL